VVGRKRNSTLTTSRGRIYRDVRVFIDTGFELSCSKRRSILLPSFKHCMKQNQVGGYKEHQGKRQTDWEKMLAPHVTIHL
jgi:hypothetical protein